MEICKLFISRHYREIRSSPLRKIWAYAAGGEESNADFLAVAAFHMNDGEDQKAPGALLGVTTQAQSDSDSLASRQSQKVRWHAV